MAQTYYLFSMLLLAMTLNVCQPISCAHSAKALVKNVNVATTFPASPNKWFVAITFTPLITIPNDASTMFTLKAYNKSNPYQIIETSTVPFCDFTSDFDGTCLFYKNVPKTITNGNITLILNLIER